MRQITRLTWPLTILFQAIIRLKAFWLPAVVQLQLCSCSCAKHDDSASVSVSRVTWTCKGGVNSASGENWKEPSSFTISTEALFYGDSNEETLNVNKAC